MAQDQLADAVPVAQEHGLRNPLVAHDLRGLQHIVGISLGEHHALGLLARPVHDPGHQLLVMPTRLRSSASYCRQSVIALRAAPDSMAARATAGATVVRRRGSRGFGMR